MGRCSLVDQLCAPTPPTVVVIVQALHRAARGVLAVPIRGGVSVPAAGNQAAYMSFLRTTGTGGSSLVALPGDSGPWV